MLNQEEMRLSQAESTYKMNFAILWFTLPLWGLSLARDDGNTSVTPSYPSDMFDLLREFGAMSEKVRMMETKLKDSETRLKDSENKIVALEQKERKAVIFSAALGVGNTPYGPFNTGITLIYRRVLTNIGNAYGQFTGIFTAPVAGVYYFTLFFHAGGNYRGRLYLMKNNDAMVMTSDHQSNTDVADNGGNAAFLQLQRGDQVYVHMAQNSHVWGSNFHTTFSGFLVTQM